MKQKYSEFIDAYLAKTSRMVEQLETPGISNIIEILEDSRREGKQIFVCGNGGSAATASHFAVDMGKGASLNRDPRFKIICLNDNTPWITALGNDFSYDKIFVEQLKNFASEGDVLVTISGSGNSPNIIEAVEWANSKGVLTIGLTGRPGGKLGQIAEHPVFVDSSHMGRIEDGHSLILHVVGYYFMENQE
ncbi:MAG: SIS domain-containing protein [Anaerolineales bacterium]|nr:SIS domain-containing protein [Anaerolineales bacterium]